MITKDQICLAHTKIHSLGELLNSLRNKSKYVYEPARRSSDNSEKSYQDWTLTKNLEEAISLATDGWPKGLEASLKLTEKYKDKFAEYFPKQDYASEVHYDVSGEYVDMDRAISGEPENMIRYESSNKITGGGRLQRIIVNCSINAGVFSENVFYRGAVITSMIHSMELYGFRTEVICRNVGRNEDVYTIEDIKIKQFDENPDIDKIAFCLAHPSMQRRLLFAICEQYEKKIVDRIPFHNQSMLGYGRSDDYTIDIGENDLYLAFLETTTTSFKSCYEFVRQKLDKHFKTIIVKE